MRRRIRWPAGVLVLALALTGCRKSETVTAGGSTVEVDRSTTSVTIRTAATPVTAGAVPGLPASFPKDVPIYPGARVALALDAVGQTAGHVATLETADWPEDVAKFYREKLPGWKTAMDMKTADAHTLILRSPDAQRSLTLSATREALKTVFTLTVAAK
jgi:hypothetical protein